MRETTGHQPAVPTPRAPGDPTAPQLARTARAACASAALGVTLLVAAGSGTSAATPPLGARSALPPWDLGPRLSSVAVTVGLVAAYLLGCAAVLLGLRAVAAGWRPRPRTVAIAATAAVAALVLVAPFGSADHLSYAAYGRIAAQGGDPYVVSPGQWHGGLDPVAGAARAPWRDTTSVYGPVATVLQAATSLAGGTSVRRTVWAWQLLVGACFLLTGWLLDRLARRDSQRRSRAAVLWSANPLLLGAVVGGAHLDGVCAAAATACLVVGVRARNRGRLAEASLDVLTGAAWGVAAGTKLPYAAVGAALVWALRRNRPRELAGALLAGTIGAALVLVPAHLWAGPHVYDQAGAASRFVSLATVWRGGVNAVELVTGSGVRAAIPLVFAVVACVVLVAVWALLTASRRSGHDGVGLGSGSETDVDAVPDDAVLALLALTAAYLLAAPYVLPWYDALVWAPLAVAGSTALDRPLLLRLTALAIAYVPGRVEGVAPDVSTVMLGVREFAAPVVTGGVLTWVLVHGARARRAGRRDSPAVPPRAR